MIEPMLKGCRILDLTHVWAGPKCTQVLAYLGAEVIKIESPKRPDMARGPKGAKAGSIYPGGVGGDQPYNRAGNFIANNRRKLALTLDLNDERGVAVFKRLLAICDVVVENFSAGVLDKLGLDFNTLRSINPHIIKLSMPGFGSTGAERSYISFAPTISSTAGVLNAIRYEGGTPLDEGVGLPDPFAGMFGAAAVLTSLYERSRDQHAQNLELAQREALLTLNAEPLMRWQRNHGESVHIDTFVPQGVYPTSEKDVWVALSVQSEAAWQELCKVIGREDFSRAQFSSAAGRQAHAAEIHAALVAWASKHTASEAARQLQSANVVAGAVLDDPKIAADEHLHARGFFEVVGHAAVGEYSYAIPLGAKFSRSAARPPAPAPLFGEHNRFVLGEIVGLSNAEIDALVAAGVVCDTPC